MSYEAALSQLENLRCNAFRSLKSASQTHESLASALNILQSKTLPTDIRLASLPFFTVTPINLSTLLDSIFVSDKIYSGLLSSPYLPQILLGLYYHQKKHLQFFKQKFSELGTTDREISYALGLKFYYANLTENFVLQQKPLENNRSFDFQDDLSKLQYLGYQMQHIVQPTWIDSNINNLSSSDAIFGYLIFGTTRLSLELILEKLEKGFPETEEITQFNLLLKRKFKYLSSKTASKLFKSLVKTCLHKPIFSSSIYSFFDGISLPSPYTEITPTDSIVLPSLCRPEGYDFNKFYLKLQLMVYLTSTDVKENLTVLKIEFYGYRFDINITRPDHFEVLINGNNQLTLPFDQLFTNFGVWNELTFEISSVNGSLSCGVNNKFIKVNHKLRLNFFSSTFHNVRISFEKGLKWLRVGRFQVMINDDVTAKMSDFSPSFEIYKQTDEGTEIQANVLDNLVLKSTGCEV